MRGEREGLLMGKGLLEGDENVLKKKNSGKVCTTL